MPDEKSLTCVILTSTTCCMLCILKLRLVSESIKISWDGHYWDKDKFDSSVHVPKDYKNWLYAQNCSEAKWIRV